MKKTIIICLILTAIINSQTIPYQYLIIDDDLRAHPLMFYNHDSDIYQKGIIKEIHRPANQNSINVTVKIGDTLYNADYYNQKNNPIHINNRVLLHIFANDDIVVDNIFRLYRVVIFILIVIALFTILCKKLAFKVLVILFLIGIISYYFLIPQLLKGLSVKIILFSAILLFISASSIFILGYNRKSFVSIISILTGFIFGYIIITYFINTLEITGFYSSIFQLLDYHFRINNSIVPFKFSELIFAIVMISVLGIIFDIIVVETNTIFELSEINPDISFIDLLKSGLEVGRDIIGTLINTLAFAYIGTGLITLLILSKTSESVLLFINSEFFKILFVKIVIGSQIFILMIPITVFYASIFAYKKNQLNGSKCIS